MTRNQIAFVVGMVLLVLGLGFAPALQNAKYSVKVEKAAPPAELNAAVAKLLNDESVQLLDPKGNLVGEVWFRKEVPADATAEQVKNGLTYRELKETTVLGAIRFPQGYADYRKQKIKAGVYTLRLGFQPQDGDHAGSSAHQEFVVLLPAAKDTNPAAIEAKTMIETSAKGIDAGHPAVFMLFPHSKPGAPQVAGKANDHWVVNAGVTASAAGLKTPLGIGLTLVGHAE